jgi:hypothetical protein
VLADDGLYSVESVREHTYEIIAVAAEARASLEGALWLLDAVANAMGPSTTDVRLAVEADSERYHRTHI